MTDFYKQLHEIAIQASQDFSYEGDEGERGHWLEYSGSLVGNYPWIYIRFAIRGAIVLESLVEVENRFKEACAACPQVANYLSTSVGNDMVQYRLIYREDLNR